MATKLAKEFRVRPNWLLTGELPVRSDSSAVQGVEEAYLAGWRAALHAVEQQLRMLVEEPERSKVRSFEQASSLVAVKRQRRELEDRGLLDRRVRNPARRRHKEA